MIALISDTITNMNKMSISCPNVYILNQVSKNSALKDSLDKIDILFPDGIGIYLASKFLYGKEGLKHLTKGTDLYYKILKYANDNHLKMFFYGGDDKSSLRLESVLKSSYPNITIKGIFSRNSKDKNLIINNIISSSPDILFIGLGTPLQEYFISENSEKLNVPVSIAMGSGIDFISGYMKRAPKWMLKLQLEWLFRLFYEPARLWKRYIIGIPVFIFKVLIFKFKK